MRDDALIIAAAVDSTIAMTVMDVVVRRRHAEMMTHSEVSEMIQTLLVKPQIAYSIHPTLYSATI